MASRERRQQDFAKLTIRFPRALLIWARAEARRQDRSLNSFMVRMISRHRLAIQKKARTVRDAPTDSPTLPPVA